ncbi:MAG TPA: hypothetical protein PLD59_12985, partial [Tepidisphaeraceae bacterium]|nr:hypothetical protein [Tepidisphaeraceae bacterium]
MSDGRQSARTGYPATFARKISRIKSPSALPGLPEASDLFTKPPPPPGQAEAFNDTSFERYRTV